MKIFFRLTYLLICCLFFSKNNALANVTINFSHERGFHTKNFNLAIKTSGKDVKARYTLDGSEPTQSYGTIFNTEGSFLIPGMHKSTVVRVFAYNTEESVSASHTYIFKDDVFTQNNSTVINELKYSDKWGIGTSFSGGGDCETQSANYGMSIDECITNTSEYEQKLYNGLMQIPTMAISLDKQQIFGSDSGLYVYPVQKSDDCYTLPDNVDSWERKVSVEIFNDQQVGKNSSIQVDAGFKISGYSSRYLDFYKHSFQLNFKEEYGAEKFSYPLYGEDEAGSFKTLELRMIAHSSPHDWVDSRREESQFHKDNWTRSLQKQMSGSGSSPNSRFFHLFINGLYWGIYDVCERPDANYMTSYNGGEPDDYDVINFENVENGSDTDYKYMYDIAHSIYDTIFTNPQINPFTNDTVYDKAIVVNEERAHSFYNEIENMLDIEKFIDYNLLNLYLVNADWRDNNWWASRNVSNNGKFQFFVWDAEIVLNNAGISNQVLLLTGNSDTLFKYHPIDLNQRLLDVPEYKIKFGDHIQCHCVEEDGLLNEGNLINSYKEAEEKIHNATMLEFVRWGDVRKDDTRYQPICFDVVEKTLQNYEAEIFPNLLNNMLLLYGLPGGEYEILPNYIKRVRDNGVYTFEEIFNFKAVEFSKKGGEVEAGDLLELTNPNAVGEIYYTTDGSDPRNVDGTIAANAIKYTSPVIIDEQTVVKARVFTETFTYQDLTTKTIDNLWSAMCPRKFFMPGEVVSTNTFDNVTNINVFPKPVKDQLNITGLPLKANQIVKVYAINGQKIIEHKVVETTKTLNTAHLPSGHYLITISKQNELIFADKFIKMN